MKRRWQAIVDLLKQSSELDVATLVERLGVSEATIRRDLTMLQGEGVVIRTFGGAKLRETPSLTVRTFAQKREQMRKEKEGIAAAAAKLVEPGMSVILDSGTTIWRLAVALKDKAPLTVFTSALAPVEELGSVPGMTIRLTGGAFRQENLDFVGPSSLAAFAEFRADIAFVSADLFIPDKGAYAANEWSAAVGRRIARSAERRVLLLDHGKFAGSASYLTLAAGETDVLITDSGVDPETREALDAGPYELIVAD